MKKRYEKITFVHEIPYRHVSRDLAYSIRHNSDPSYTQRSPAKILAIDSTTHWLNLGEMKLLNVMSTDYANYRQYQCGGIPEALLVVVTPTDRAKMRQRFADVLHKTR